MFPESLEHVRDYWSDQLQAEDFRARLACACCAQARPVETVQTAQGPQLLCGTCTEIVGER